VDLDELRAFITVVDTGSIQAASRTLRFARATLRRRLDELSARAGVPLLYRTDDRLAPTDAGLVLARRGRVILQEAGALLSSVREVGGEAIGCVRVLAPIGLPPLVLAPMLAMFRARFPKLSLQLHFSDDPMSRLLDDVDVAVHFGEATPPGPWQSFELVRMRDCLMGSPAYLVQRGTPKVLADLAHHEIYRGVSPGDAPELLPLRTGATVRIAPTLVSSDMHVLRRCAALGGGLAYVPDTHGTPLGSLDAMVPVLLDLVGRDRPVRVAVPEAIVEIPRIRAVVDELRRFVTQRAPNQADADPASIVIPEHARAQLR